MKTNKSRICLKINHQTNDYEIFTIQVSHHQWIKEFFRVFSNHFLLSDHHHHIIQMKINEWSWNIKIILVENERKNMDFFLLLPSFVVIIEFIYFIVMGCNFLSSSLSSFFVVKAAKKGFGKNIPNKLTMFIMMMMIVNSYRKEFHSRNLFPFHYYIYDIYGIYIVVE